MPGPTKVRFTPAELDAIAKSDKPFSVEELRALDPTDAQTYINSTITAKQDSGQIDQPSVDWPIIGALGGLGAGAIGEGMAGLGSKVVQAGKYAGHTLAGGAVLGGTNWLLQKMGVPAEMANMVTLGMAMHPGGPGGGRAKMEEPPHVPTAEGYEAHMPNTSQPGPFSSTSKGTNRVGGRITGDPEAAATASPLDNPVERYMPNTSAASHAASAEDAAITAPPRAANPTASDPLAGQVTRGRTLDPNQALEGGDIFERVMQGAKVDRGGVPPGAPQGVEKSIFGPQASEAATFGARPPAYPSNVSTQESFQDLLDRVLGSSRAGGAKYPLMFHGPDGPAMRSSVEKAKRAPKRRSPIDPG